MVSGPEPVFLLVEKAVAGDLDIPEFQRGFVWRPDQVKALADSLFRDYPVGQLLLWKNRNYIEPRSTLSGAMEVNWIVDGQQRTTALCMLFNKKPYWFDNRNWNEHARKNEVFFNVLPVNGVYTFSFKNPSLENRPEWISVSRVVNLDKNQLGPLAIEILNKMGKDIGVAGADFTAIYDSLQRLHGIRNKTIFEQEIGNDPEDVAEIFGRLNSSGTKVKEADIFVALIAAKNKGWVREKFLPFVESLEEDGYDLEPGIFIRTMFAINTGKADLRDVGSDFWKADLNQIWEQTEESMTHTIQRLTEKGILNSEILPSKNALIPLFVLYAKFGQSVNFNRALYWFLVAMWDGRYGGSANTILTTDAQIISKASTFDEAVDSLLHELPDFPPLSEEDFLTPYNKDKFLALLTYLLIFDKQAMDWLEQGHRIGYDKSDAVLNRGYKPEWNHFFPRGKNVLRAQGNNFTEEEINALANITIITESANRTISSNPPSAYISKLGIPQAYLDQQFIPSGIPLEVSSYREFLKARAHLLAENATSLMQSLMH